MPLGSVYDALALCQASGRCWGRQSGMRRDFYPQRTELSSHPDKAEPWEVHRAVAVGFEDRGTTDSFRSRTEGGGVKARQEDWIRPDVCIEERHSEGRVL